MLMLASPTTRTSALAWLALALLGSCGVLLSSTSAPAVVGSTRNGAPLNFSVYLQPPSVPNSKIIELIDARTALLTLDVAQRMALFSFISAGATAPASVASRQAWVVS